MCNLERFYVKSKGILSVFNLNQDSILNQEIDSVSDNLEWTHRLTNFKDIFSRMKVTYKKREKILFDFCRNSVEIL